MPACRRGEAHGDEEAHGNGGRLSQDGGAQFYRQGAQGRQAVLRLVELDRMHIFTT